MSDPAPKPNANKPAPRGRGRARRPTTASKDIPLPGGPEEGSGKAQTAPPAGPASTKKTTEKAPPSVKTAAGPSAKAAPAKAAEKKKKASASAGKAPSGRTATKPLTEAEKEMDRKIVKKFKRLLAKQKAEKERIRNIFGDAFCDAPWNEKNSTGYDPEWGMKNDPEEIRRLKEVDHG